MKYCPGKFLQLKALSVLTIAFLSFGCNLIKKESKTPVLLKTENAQQSDLMKEVNRFARVNSLRAKMDFKFEDNSFAVFGMKESYRQAPGEIVVQRPNRILVKVQAPIIGSDIAQMTSDGDTFRVAVLNAGSCSECKKFIKGTNNADYSKLQKAIPKTEAIDGKTAKENVSAFANLRPQHFTEAMLVRPITEGFAYAQSTIFQIEEDTSLDSKSPVRKVMRGYYLLDEYAKTDDGSLKIVRRFWFDRVGGIRLARQQLFDIQGEIESDIVYGKEGNLGETTDYANLPLEIWVTRPKEKYSMRMTYQTPGAVVIGNAFPEAAFVLQNTWNLEEVDLDKKLREMSAEKKPELDSKNIKTFH